MGNSRDQGAGARDQGLGPHDRGSEPASPKLTPSQPSEGGKYCAIDVQGIDSDFLLALVDDFNPSAVDTQGSIVTVFFPDAGRRDGARDVVVQAYPDAHVEAREVDDENWARRSQENLTPVTVGRITVAPPWADDVAADSESQANPELQVPNAEPRPVVLVIAPSMGFGTGHHATTRLCLRALQELDLTGSRALDVGTGSGVLAIAARLLGASEAIGIDDDADAIQAATENLSFNPSVDHVRFDVKDLRAAPLPRADAITANLTGALLIKSAPLLLRALNPDGWLIVSGIQTHERDDVVRAFRGAQVVWESSEDEWVAIIFRL